MPGGYFLRFNTEPPRVDLNQVDLLFGFGPSKKRVRTRALLSALKQEHLCGWRHGRRCLGILIASHEADLMADITHECAHLLRIGAVEISPVTKASLVTR